MRAGQQISVPIGPLPACQAGQADPQIVRDLPDCAPARFCKPHGFLFKFFRENPSISFANRVPLLRETLPESPSTFSGKSIPADVLNSNFIPTETIRQWSAIRHRPRATLRRSSPKLVPKWHRPPCSPLLLSLRNAGSVWSGASFCGSPVRPARA